MPLNQKHVIWPTAEVRKEIWIHGGRSTILLAQKEGTKREWLITVATAEYPFHLTKVLELPYYGN